MITFPTDKLQKVVLGGGTEQSGTPTPDNPIDIVCNNGVLKVSSNGQIYADGIQETIEVHGKNLLNPATRTDGYYISANGNIAQDLDFCCSALIPVKPNTNYMLSGITGAVEGNRRLHAYDSNGNWISQIRRAYTIAGNTYNITGTTPNNCAYVRISIGMADTNVQLELGSTATAYEPYFNGGTAIAEMLLKVGQYKDEQSVLDGVVTRKVGVRVLKGTDADLHYYGVYRGHNLFYFNVAPDEYWINRGDIIPVCSHYNGYEGDAAKMPNQNIRFQNRNDATETNLSRLYLADDRFDNSSDLKTWLTAQYNAGTPVIIVYPLATPTTEQVTGQTLRGNNSVTQIAGSIDNLPIESSTIAELKKRYIGDKEVKRVYIGDNLVWEK